MLKHSDYSGIIAAKNIALMCTDVGGRSQVSINSIYEHYGNEIGLMAAVAASSLDSWLALFPRTNQQLPGNKSMKLLLWSPFHSKMVSRDASLSEEEICLIYLEGFCPLH